MKIRLFAVLFAALLCAPLFSACDTVGFASGGVSELLKAPTLNRRQAEIYAALEATIHLPDIVFRYPNNGENRTPFVFYDINGDGFDEAIVFYSYTERPLEVRAKILRQDADGWHPFSDISGQGDQIDFVEIANIASRDKLNVLIGWQDTSRNDYTLEIFSVDVGGFVREAVHKYTALTVVDYGGNDLSRVVLVVRENRNSGYEARMIGGLNGQVDLITSVTLFEDVEDILEMKIGPLWDGSLAVFIDELFDNETVATEIIRVSPAGLVPVAGAQYGELSPQWSYYMETFRPDRVLSLDVDNDDYIEIPRNIEMPGTAGDDSLPPQMLTVYRRPSPDGLVAVCTAALNVADGYLIFYPERWLERVTVVSYPEAGQWRLYKVDEFTQEPATELLRVTRYQSKDYIGADAEENIPLDTRGAMRYYGYIPASSAGDDLAITEDELTQMMFSLL